MLKNNAIILFMECLYTHLEREWYQCYYHIKIQNESKFTYQPCKKYKQNSETTELKSTHENHIIVLSSYNIGLY